MSPGTMSLARTFWTPSLSERITLPISGSYSLRASIADSALRSWNQIHKWNQSQTHKKSWAKILVKNCKKNRQIEGRSALLSKNVNKSWRFFFVFWHFWGFFNTVSLQKSNLYIAWVGVSFVAKRKILQPQSSRWNFNNSAVRSRMSCRSSLSFLCYDAKMLSRMKLC